MSLAKKLFKLTLLNGRFYVLSFTLGLVLLLAGVLRYYYQDNLLFTIRLEQSLGGLAILYWYVVLTISPLSYVFKGNLVKKLLYLRRGIGVSTALLAGLHMMIALFGQLGGLSYLGLMPERFFWALILGFIAFLVLFVMLITSFDKIVNLFGYRKWKLLHRTSYLAGVLVVLHVWLIGSHVTPILSAIAFCLLVILLGLESWRFAIFLTKRFKIEGPDTKLIIFASFWFLTSGLIYVIPSVVAPYHGVKRTVTNNSPTKQHQHGGGFNYEQ